MDTAGDGTDWDEEPAGTDLRRSGDRWSLLQVEQIYVGSDSSGVDDTCISGCSSLSSHCF